MEEMMKKMILLERAQSRENQSAPQNRNISQNQTQNLRRNQPQNRPRDPDEDIIPPFHQNYVSEVEETIEKIEEDDINMLGIDNDDFEAHYNRNQGLYIPYDDKRPEDEYYYQEIENVIIETPKEYDLRSRKNQETPKTKTSDKSTQKNPVNKPKIMKYKGKTVVGNSDKNKEKSTEDNEKQSADLSSVSTSASAPVKTILTNVNRENQQADRADKVVVNKAETNIVRT